MRTIEETLSDVAFKKNYINYDGFIKEFNIPRERVLEFTEFIADVAKEYSADAEKYYCVNSDLEAKISRLEDEIEDLEMEIDFLEDENSDLEDTIAELTNQLLGNED